LRAFCCLKAFLLDFCFTLLRVICCGNAILIFQELAMATISIRGGYQFQAIIRRKDYPAQTKTFETRADAAEDLFPIRCA